MAYVWKQWQSTKPRRFHFFSITYGDRAPSLISDVPWKTMYGAATTLWKIRTNDHSQESHLRVLKPEA